MMPEASEIENGKLCQRRCSLALGPLYFRRQCHVPVR